MFYHDNALFLLMKSNSSDLDRMISKAAVEAAKMGSQAQQAAKRIFDQMSTDTGEKGYDLPAIDILDTNEELIALVSLPGATKNNIDLKVTEDSLAIGAQTTPKEMKYLRRETSPKGFKREIKLPEEIKPEQVKASYDNGILEVHLPKLVVISRQKVQVD